MFMDASATYFFYTNHQHQIERRNIQHPVAPDNTLGAWRMIGSRCTDAGQLLVSDENHALNLIDAATLKTQATWAKQTKVAWVQLDISQDGQRIAALSRHGALSIFDLETRQVLNHTLASIHDAAMALSPDGQWLALATTHENGGQIKLWHLEAGHITLQTRALDRRAIRGPTTALDKPTYFKLAFNPDCSLLSIYESTYGEDDWRATVNVYTTSGQFLWSACIDEQLTGDASALHTLLVDPARGYPGSIWFDRRGKHLYCSGAPGVIFCLDVRDGALISTHIQQTTMPITSLCQDAQDHLWAHSLNDHIFQIIEH